MKDKCCAKLKNVFGICERPGTIEREGKFYCWRHDPVKITEEAKRAWELRKIQLAEDEAKFERNHLRRKLEERAGIKSLTNDELKVIADFGGIKAMLAELEPRIKRSQNVN